MPITLVQITDTHIHDQANVTFKATQPDVYLQRIIKHIQYHIASIDYLIGTGDLTHDGGQLAAKKLQHFLNEFDCPVFVTPGNHDESRIFQDYLLNAKISMPEQMDLGAWQLLFADSHVDFQTDGYIDYSVINRLKRLLHNNKTPAILFTHHPPLSINSQWMDEIGMQNGAQLLNQLSLHQSLKAIVFGHIHQHWDSQYQHLRLLGTPSTCVQFKPLSEDFGIDEVDPGYRIIRLHDHHIETQVIRCSMQLNTVISGGQSGVDRAALDAAIQLSIAHGGWCPQGRRAIDGMIDERYQLTETPSAHYSQRTEWNIRDSDATLILGWGPLDGGSALTAKLAGQMKKTTDDYRPPAASNNQ